MSAESTVGIPLPLRTETSRGGIVDRVRAAKASFVTRRANLADLADLKERGRPQAGDLVLARVVELGHHARLELPTGRRAQLYPGDEILVAYGQRYAPDQFEAVVPQDLSSCDLVAGGGIAARMLAKHSQTRKPTSIAPIGLLADRFGETINLRRFAISRPPASGAKNIVAVVGTSMNAGKTTLAANLIRGLSRSGARVGACKVTGTGSGGDLWSMTDAGAKVAMDFTDVGFATTAGLPIADAEAAAHTLVSHLEAADVDVIVVEIADGLLQRETAALLTLPSTFPARIDSFILAAADAMGAHAGVQWLRARNLPLVAVSGLVTASPLATREAQGATEIEVVHTRTLAEPDYAARLCLAAPIKRSVFA